MFNCKKKIIEDDIKLSHVRENDPEYLKIMLKLLDVKEIKGVKHNSKIELMFETVTGKAYSDETPWCAACMGFCLMEAGYKSTGKLNARSYLKYGVEMHRGIAIRGCIVVLWRGKKDGWQGHVGIFLGWEGDYMIILGGNQGDKVSIQRYHKRKLLSFRRPTDEDLMASN